MPHLVCQRQQALCTNNVQLHRHPEYTSTALKNSSITTAPQHLIEFDSGGAMENHGDSVAQSVHVSRHHAELVLGEVA